LDCHRPQGASPPRRLSADAGCVFLRGISFIWRRGKKLEGITLRVFGSAKTVADCFEFRKKIGLEVALEALRDCYRQRKATMDELFTAAKTRRVARVM
jgi:hypothetical protein